MTDTTWTELREELAADQAAPSPLLDLPQPSGDAPVDAGDFLLGVITARDEEELSLLHSPEIRQAAVDLMLERRLHRGIPELTFFLREHWFYEGETEEISQRLEKLHSLALRPYFGLETPEMLQVILEDLFGHRAEPDAILPSGELQAVRMVAWATREQVPLTRPSALRTLEDLASEVFELGL